MSCIKNCKLCRNFIISQTVTFDGTSLVINLPERAYNDNCKYCIVVAQTIPDTATINAPVVFTIGTGTTQYQFLDRCCEPILASQIRTRRIYPSRVSTSIATGVFRYIGTYDLPCTGNINAESLPIAEETAAPVVPDGGGA